MSKDAPQNLIIPPEMKGELNSTNGSQHPVKLIYAYVREQSKPSSGYTKIEGDFWGGWVRFNTESPVTFVDPEKFPTKITANWVLLPENVKLRYLGKSTATGKQRFKVEDGNYVNSYNGQQGDRGSVVGAVVLLEDNEVNTYLKANAPKQEAAQVTIVYGSQIKEKSTYSGKEMQQQFAILQTGDGTVSRLTLNSEWGLVLNGMRNALNGNFRYTPIPITTGIGHRILVPDNCHIRTSTRVYSDTLSTASAKGHDAWFPIVLEGSDGQQSSRYIHMGQISHGCVTVYEYGQWGAIYDYLISHRVPKRMGTTIGYLKVVDPHKLRSETWAWSPMDSLGSAL